MITLLPHQKQGTRAVYRFGGRALIADEMGLGKTIQALHWIRKTPGHRPVVIVTPSSVKYQWQSEAMDHFGIRVQVLEGQRPNGAHFDDIIVINYDILPYWIGKLVKLRPKTVVLDECQYVKTLGALRTRAARKLAARAASVVALSGTPLTNRPIELWSVLNIIRPDLFPDRTKYAWRYCRPRRTIWGWKFDGADRLPELHRILRQECMVRRLKKEVMPYLPDKTHIFVPFQLSDYTEYIEARDDFLRWLGKISPSKAKRAKKSQALVRVGYLLRLCVRLRLQWTTKWLQEWSEANPGEKLVALTMHTFVIDHLKAKFPNSVVIDGRVTGLKRVESVRKFQSNRRVQFLFGNWKAAGIGLNLTASNVMVSLDFPWTPGDLLQGQDRVHRIGQKRKVLIYYLYLLHSIEEKQMRGLQKKHEILESVLNGQVSSKDFDLYNNLIKELKHE